MNTKTKSIIVALITAFQIAIVPVASAGFLPVRAYGTDTVAGYPSMLKTSLINPGQNVVFVVEKPDTSVAKVPAQADLEGVAEAELYGLQTKQAGTYKVAVLFPGSVDSSPQNTFKVYPGQVSTTQSSITSTSQMVTADGEEKTFVTVTLYDEYRNPIGNHKVQLISSRKEDTVEALNNAVTDEYGRASFKVTSEYAGVSVYTAIDNTLSQILTDREEIVFYAPVKTESVFGGNWFTANMFQADIGQGVTDVLPGPVDHFVIEGLPSTVKINTDQTITVTAQDKNSNTAKNYTGTIIFSVPDDENAILPNNGEYAFKESDQGKFTFNLALRFTKIGNQTVQVFDKSNWKITGEKAVEVVPEKAVVTSPLSTTLSIKSPVDGAELGNSLVVISGQGDPNINLKVFDNDIKIGDSAETDSDGFFTYQAQNMQSGSHTFYAMSEAGDISPSISILIDTVPPVLNSFEIDPEGNVTPGTQLTVTIQSEPNLEEAKVRVQGAEEILSPVGDQPGTYTAVIAAPVVDGSYPIDVILVDKLSNKTEIQNKTTVQVTTQKEVKPPVVQGVTGAPGDGQAILTWYEITDHTVPIQKYKIYYGTKFDLLDKTVETPSAVTSYTVTGLENDKQYFFAVRAVDSKSLESEKDSVVIALTPSGTPEEETPGEGETTLPTETVSGTGLSGTASQNSVTLNWQPLGGIQTYFYKIYFGIQTGQYSDYVVTSNNSLGATVSDLIPGLKYYFAVVALDLSGREVSALSNEISLTPSGAGFHSAPPSYTQSGTTTPIYADQFQKVPSNEKTGPETVWLVLISIIAANILYRYKRKIVKS